MSKGRQVSHKPLRLCEKVKAVPKKEHAISQFFDHVLLRVLKSYKVCFGFCQNTHASFEIIILL